METLGEALDRAREDIRRRELAEAYRKGYNDGREDAAVWANVNAREGD